MCESVCARCDLLSFFSCVARSWILQELLWWGTGMIIVVMCGLYNLFKCLWAFSVAIQTVIVGHKVQTF